MIYPKGEDINITSTIVMQNSLRSSPLATPARPSGLACAWPSPRRRAGCHAAQARSNNSEEDLDQLLQQDMERLRQRQDQQQGGPSSFSAPPGGVAPPAASTSGGGGGLQEIVDKVLIADFFFILAALAWLGAGLVERSALNSTRLLDTWLGLWQLVWQPALGVLMLGAIVSGGAGWAKDKLKGGSK